MTAYQPRNKNVREKSMIHGQRVLLACAAGRAFMVVVMKSILSVKAPNGA